MLSYWGGLHTTREQPHFEPEPDEKLGKGPHSKAGGVAKGFAAGSEAGVPLFRLGGRCFFAFVEPRDPPEGWELPNGLNSSAGIPSTGTSVAGITLANSDSPGGIAIIIGVVKMFGAMGVAMGAVAALTLRSGSERTCRSAFFRRRADRSAFSAAAVVAATFGVTVNERGFSASGRRLSLTLAGWPASSISSLETRAANRATSSPCCSITISIFL